MKPNFQSPLGKEGQRRARGDLPESAASLSIFYRLSREAEVPVLLLDLQGETTPFRVQFDRVMADLDHRVALNGISFMREGEWSTVDLDEGQASVGLR